MSMIVTTLDLCHYSYINWSPSACNKRSIHLQVAPGSNLKHSNEWSTLRQKLTGTRGERSKNIIRFLQISSTNRGSIVMRKWLDFLFCCMAAEALSISRPPPLTLSLMPTATVDLLNSLFTSCSGFLNSKSHRYSDSFFVLMFVSASVFLFLPSPDFIGCFLRSAKIYFSTDRKILPTSLHNLWHRFPFSS